MLFTILFKFKIKQCQKFRIFHSWSVMFFGNDIFSLRSLVKLKENVGKNKLINRLEIVTSAKRVNPVIEYAQSNNLKIHPWPPNKPQENFDFGIVVSFGHLIPKAIIDYFPLGIFNVHASLLPRWRGAAPIIHALINGDTETGISIMKINPDKFDTGQIIMQRPCTIDPHDLQPYLYEKLSIMGAECLIETIETLPDCLNHARSQGELKGTVTNAPRITKVSALVDWKELTAAQIYNLYRGLHGIYELRTLFHSLPVKLTKVKLFDPSKFDYKDARQISGPGDIHYSRETKLLHVQCKNDTWIRVIEIVIAGKRISPSDFYNGYIAKVGVDKRYFTTF